MSENSQTIRPRFSDLRLMPENKEFGEQYLVEFALLNGYTPKESGIVNIPEATATLKVHFPAGTDFMRMANVMERLDAAVRDACAECVTELAR